jgi:hypothetical protein
MDTKTCPKCGACWIGGQHFWSGTGKEGDPHDLAGLVCNRFGDDTCINPCRGSTSGTTWQDRLGTMNALEKDLKKVNG